MWDRREGEREEGREVLSALSVPILLWDGSIPGNVWGTTTADESEGTEHGTGTTVERERNGDPSGAELRGEEIDADAQELLLRRSLNHS